MAMGGSALVKAIEQVLDRARAVAAALLGVRSSRCRGPGPAGSPPTAGRATLAEVVAAAGGLEAEARFESGLVFGSGAYAAVVEIERATGRLRVCRLAAVDDAGTDPQPAAAPRARCSAGSCRGSARALVEEAVFDEHGQPRSASFADYSLLTAVELPPIEARFVQTPTPLQSARAPRAIGEGGAIGTPAAIASAVADALGRPAPDPPLTAEKLWRALRGLG